MDTCSVQTMQDRPGRSSLRTWARFTTCSSFPTDQPTASHVTTSPGTLRAAMDRAAIEELFTFTEYSWREHVQLIRPHGDRALTHPAPGSGWPALRDALAHICWRTCGG